MSHDRPRVRKEDIDHQKEQVKKLKIQEFVNFKNKLVDGRSHGHYELEILDSLDKGVMLGPDINTLWNYRKQILCHYMQQELDQGNMPWVTLGESEKSENLSGGGNADEKAVVEKSKMIVFEKETFPYDLNASELQIWKHEKLRQLFERELDITEKVLRERHLKSYGCWYHRKWIIKHLPHRWQSDLQLTALLLSARVDERNFHCWNYRRYVLELARLPPKEELDFTMERIIEQTSNYSAWHNRSSLLWQCNRAEQKANDEGDDDEQGVRNEWIEPVEEVLSREFEVVQDLFYTDPKDQSAWIYHRWLLHTPESQSLLDKSLESCKELLDALDDPIECKWVMLTIVLNQMQSDKVLSDEETQYNVDLLDKLIEIDATHKHYYTDLKSDFRIRSQYLSSLSTISFSLPSAHLTRIDYLSKCPEQLVDRIEHVNLSNNEIRFIPRLKNMSGVQTLDLSSNQIEFVENLKQFPQLKELDLSNNKIARLNDEDGPLSESVTRVRLANNPIAQSVSSTDQLTRFFPNAEIVLE